MEKKRESKKIEKNLKKLLTTLKNDDILIELSLMRQ